MFQMLNEESTSPKDRNMALVKVGVVTVALVAMGTAFYFVVFYTYLHG